ncbi:MAG: N-acetylglucosamine kinase [Chitinophagaceae bacterium]|nr:N-acetylglucosamine kinase [Chitinophagaceae bacterium]
MAVLIADSGSTKCEWRWVDGRKNASIFTQGMSPYFLTPEKMEEVINTELKSQMKRTNPDAIHFYGTGNKDPRNAKRTKKILEKTFPGAEVTVNHDLLGITRASCQHEPGIACILGTGSNSCFYNGKKIVKNSPGLGYVLGDEGSGAYLGRKVIQYYLYDIFEKDLKEKFHRKYKVDAADILDHVYKQPLPNRYLASFTMFLSENRGHYMIENILEDGLNDFLYYHVSRYPESAKHPVHFVGSIGYYFRDVVLSLCEAYGLRAGKILKSPIDGLVEYHRR